MDFDRIFEIMDSSFPNSEMRTYKEQKKLLDNELYHINIEVDEENKILGFLAYWDLPSCIFLEHIAVLKEKRNKGIGKKFLNDIINNSRKKIFLEAEPPVCEISKRRINYYKRFGFKLNEFFYEQPSLRESEGAQRLMIMSYPDPVNEEQFLKYKKDIFKNVYKIDNI